LETDREDLMEFAGGAAIFGAFIVFYFFVIVYSMYTRKGSGINQHPYRDPSGGMPGAHRPSDLAHDPWAVIRVRGTK
jgi:hypothetical protein